MAQATTMDTTTTAAIFLIILVILLQNRTLTFGYYLNTSTTPIQWASYMSRLCGAECRAGALHITRPMCSSSLCYPCNCEPPCHLLGTCCPTFNPNKGEHYYNVTTSTTHNPMQWFKRISCLYPPFSKDAYLAVKTCPHDWKNKKTQDNCENRNSKSFDRFTPFSDKKTGLVFQNAHCAVCNGFQIDAQRDLDTKDPGSKAHNVESLNNPNKKDGSHYKSIPSDAAQGLNSRPIAYPWKIEIRCHHYQNLYNVTDRLQLYLQASKLPECLVKFEAPFYGPGKGAPVPCEKGFNPPYEPTETCVSSDDALNQLCAEVPRYMALRVKGHRNIFCFMCKRRRPIICPVIPVEFDYSGIPVICDKEHFVELPPFQLLFHISSFLNNEKEDTETVADCRTGFWKTYEEVCVPASCSPGKLLENSTCSTAIQDIRGLAYNVSFVYQLPTDAGPDIAEKFVVHIQETIYGASRDSEMLASIVATYCFDQENSTLKYSGVSEIVVSGFVVAPLSVSRDEFEGRFIDEFLRNSFELLVGQGEDAVNTSFTMACNGHESCQLYEMLKDPLEQGCTTSVASIKKIKNESPKQDQRYTFSEDKGGYIDITPSLMCPFVALNMSTEPTFQNQTLVFTVLYRNREIKLMNNIEMTFKEDRLFVCLSYLNSVVDNLVEKSTMGLNDLVDSNIMVISYYSQIAFMVLSVLCLLAAVVTYILFPTLLALPGLNNLCLCASLATAQISLLITSIYGVRGRIRETYCTVHAIVLHYSWLASFCWMNTCCIHMYRAFTSTLCPGALSEKKTFCHYCMYSFGIPALICLATVITTTTITHGASQGYDSRICFLDFSTSSLIPILSLLVPFGASFLVNLGLFCFTVAEIAKVTRHAPTSNRSSHGVSAYVKLSTLTGLFIAVTAMGVFSGNTILTLISGPLAALQGVFIFSSFIFNKHVYGLYANLCLGTRRDRTSSMAPSTARTNKNVSTKASDV